MAPDQSAPLSKPRAGLSLYANLLNPDANSAGTISRAPVVFSQGQDSQNGDAANAQKQLNAAALRFQPTKRPQVSTQKAKPKPGFTKIPGTTIDATSTDQDTKPAGSAPAIKSTLADWTGDDDDINGFYAGEKRQRGGRKKRRKGGKEERVVLQDWDDIYDPSRPNNYEDYKNSEEKYREIKEWKDRLYAHRMAKTKQSSDYSDDSEGERPRMSSNFAPPAAYSFAPPTFDDDDKPAAPSPQTTSVPPPPPPADVPNDATGEDAYARRLRLSKMPAEPSPPPPPPPPSPPKATLPPGPPPPGSIARAPVRYQLPSAPSDLPTSEAELEKALAVEEPEAEAADASATAEEDAPRSLRPGQKGFAARLMSKYGWTKGSGLGASGSGIVNPLRVQVEKRKKKSDAEGGGFVGPAAKGRIIGAKQKAAPPEEEGAFGAMSEVVVLRGMVDGLDLDAEMEMGEGGLMQEIGEECAEKYGRVERVFIHRQHSDPATSVPVFVKFTSQLSALRAVNALEGRVFNGNSIQARFYDAEAFEGGVYE